MSSKSIAGGPSLFHIFVAERQMYYEVESWTLNASYEISASSNVS